MSFSIQNDNLVIPSILKSSSVNIGSNAGNEGGLNSIAIGLQSGQFKQGDHTIAIGELSGNTGQLNYSIAIGSESGFSDKGEYSISLGYQAGQIYQGYYSIAIGNQAGKNYQPDNSIILNADSNELSPNYSNAFYVSPIRYDGTGDSLFYNNSTKEITRGAITLPEFVKANNAIAIGLQSGQYNMQNDNAIAIGTQAGYSYQGDSSVAIGISSGQNQSQFCIAIGINSGTLNQAERAISIGADSGYNNQATNSIAIGNASGNQSQSGNAVAIGNASGYEQQGSNSVAIGASSGRGGQGSNAVAIGSEAGREGQGQYAVAIGNLAGRTNQHSNTIVLNADSTGFNTSTENAFYVNPIRNASGTSGVVHYNSSTKELTYSSAKSFIIDHPIESNKYLVHACLEGPEAGVYYRGKSEITNDESVEIILPEYAKTFSDFTVQITPILSRNDIYVSEVEDGKFTVYGKNGKFFWLVNALRESIKVETLKCDTEVRGDGPYKYIYRA